ncbi:membrane-associated phosphatidylinositol transfer protein 1 [Pseudomonas chlororaphis subsp. aurantiaca]|uniref:hypothetical protein n=1 Tax=Pseudomonas chlororaphis TaxID=587753 RepID=UPI0008658482|nr:hypothetical protein [Pseudomonas chlororaphis]BAV74160.1 membrane-associated phosphatidylinositol transfer protein 1 [Pseudomonas chlororaphis subsp. aurantiaca]
MDNMVEGFDDDVIKELARWEDAAAIEKAAGKKRGPAGMIITAERERHKDYYENADVVREIGEQVLEIQRQRYSECEEERTRKGGESLEVKLIEYADSMESARAQLNNHEEEIGKLKVHAGELESKLMSNGTGVAIGLTQRTRDYLVVAAGVLSFVGVFWFLVCASYSMIVIKPEIKIAVDIAQLIGGSLAGLGVALAGGAYAIKTLATPKSNK